MVALGNKKYTWSAGVHCKLKNKDMSTKGKWVNWASSKFKPLCTEDVIEKVKIILEQEEIFAHHPSAKA